MGKETKAKVLNGADIMLWVGGKVIALSTACKLHLEVNTSDSATKDDGLWDNADVDGVKWEVSNESFATADESRTIDEVYDKLFDMAIAGEQIDITVGVPANRSDNGLPDTGWTAPTKGRKGKGLITSVELDGTKGSKAKVSVSIKGCGALTKIGG